MTETDIKMDDVSPEVFGFLATSQMLYERVETFEEDGKNAPTYLQIQLEEDVHYVMKNVYGGGSSLVVAEQSEYKSELSTMYDGIKDMDVDPGDDPYSSSIENTNYALLNPAGAEYDTTTKNLAIMNHILLDTIENPTVDEIDLAISLGNHNGFGVESENDDG